MKTKGLILTALLSLGLTAWGEGNNTNDSNVRIVKSPRFARPLVERWISEYAKVEPSIQFQIAKGNNGQADLSVVLDNKQANAQDISHIIYIGENAVLPITTRGSEAAQVLAGKKLNNKKLKQLFFLNDDFEEDVKKNKQFERLTVYSGSNASSVAGAFARNFGQESSNFRGKRISGDDLFLNTAIDKDPLGVTFNALPNIFDLRNRRVKEDLAIIGLDLKKDLEATFTTDKATLDDIIGVLENSKVSEVAIEKVGVSYNGVDDAVGRFLQWVLTYGVKYNHDYGLLNLDQKVTDAQIAKVKSVYTAQK